ncbi:hypothetical protein K443DRAFT_635292 [Laccaria amethystina LaAM-08-1]|uniref:Uncharacterized protein n=1 Tax=Laccaria amethystina LaAM-08-1 TaxID=1095629 RepID=A0A0C9YDG7_9AGAR|nr:hypothetical protein K443DRAFT_635292 [Laccaria amethystina LaAM-08-1]
MDHSNIQIHSTVGGMSNDYKAAKEAFVLGMMDSSITHVNLVSLGGRPFSLLYPTRVASGICSKATVANLYTTPASLDDV